MGGFNLKNINENNESLSIKNGVTFTDTTSSTSSTAGAVLLSGGLSINLSTDATSSTNGGTITTAGGAAIAKTLHVGTITYSANVLLSSSGIYGLNTVDGTDNGYVILTASSGDGASRSGRIVLSGNERPSFGGNVEIYAGEAGQIHFFSDPGQILRMSISSTGITNITNTTASTSATTGALTLVGGIGINNATDATSSTNGGSLTTAGGAAIAKTLRVGGALYMKNGSWASNGDDIFINANTSSICLRPSTGTDSGEFCIDTSNFIFKNTASSVILGINKSTSVLTVNTTTASTSNTTGALTIAGGIGISNTTDATSSTNGGSITTAGGIAVAKKIYTGDSVILADSSRAIGMNTSDTETGQTCYYMDAMSAILFSGSAAGVSTGQVTPLVKNSGDDFDGLYKGTAAQYDFWRTYVNIPVGTYTFRLKAVSGSDRGIVSLVIDGTSAGTIDFYAASGVLTLGTVTSISVSTAGIKKIELQVNSKNASSSNYYFIWKNAAFIRTA